MCSAGATAAARRGLLLTSDISHQRSCWRVLALQAGDWYPEGLSSTDFRGLYGYKVFLSIAIMLVDGLYIVIKVAVV